MKSWEWYAEEAKENPPYRVKMENFSHIKSKKKRYKKEKKCRERVMKARDFEKENGFAFEDTWSLDAAIATFIYPRLAYLRDNHHGHPVLHGFKEEENGLTVPFDGDRDEAEWIEILDTMTKGFYLYATKEDYDMTEEELNLWKKTKELFVKHFESLWD